jgi:GTP-binding protein EngB required for normal cell division
MTETPSTAGLDRLTEMTRLLEDALAAVPPDHAEPLRAAQDRLRHNRFSVAVIGEFKRGKSSLINALLGEPRLLPVDIDVATSVPTVVSYGDQAQAMVHFADGSSTPSDVDRISDYVTEEANPGNRLGVRVVTVQLPNDRLTKGVMIVDTPGIGGLNVEHTAVTLEYLVNADALLFVVSAGEPLTTTELEFLSDAAHYSDFLVIALTKIDRAPEPQVFLADTRQKIADKLQVPAEQLQIVPVSSRRKLNGLVEQDPTAVATSNFAALEEVLWDGIRRRAGATVLVQVAEEVGRTLDLAAGPIGTELVALRKSSAEFHDQMARELAAVYRRVSDLAGSDAAWRTECTTALAELRDAIRTSFDRRITTARGRAQAYLDDETMLESPALLGQQVVRDIQLALTDADTSLRKGVTNLVVSLRLQTQLELSDPQLQVLSFDPLAAMPEPPPRTRASLSKRLVEAGPKALSGGSSWRKLGLLVGGGITAVGAVTVAPLLAAAGVVTIAAGTVVGTAAGFRVGLEEADREEGAARRRAVEALVDAFFTDNIERAGAALDQSIRTAETRVRADLESRLREELRSVADAESALKRAGTTQGIDLERRIAQLSARFDDVTALRQRASALGVPLIAVAAATPTEAPGATGPPLSLTSDHRTP